MALLGLDYLDCEPFELNFRLHVLGGFWPLETQTRWKQIAVSAFSFLSYFSLTSMIVIQAVDIYLLRNNPVQLTRNICSCSVSYTIVIKSLILLLKVDTAMDLKRKFTEYKNALTDPAHIAIVEKSNKRILAVVRTLYVMGGLCSLFWMLYPGLDSGDSNKVPFPYRLPVEEWSFPVWVGMYVYQSMSMVGYLINLVSVDAMFCGFVCRINAHYDIIINNLKEVEELGGENGVIGEEEEEKEALMKTFKENVKLHQELLEDIDLFQKLYSPLCMIHFIGLIVMSGTAIIEFVRIARNLDYLLQILQKLLYVAAGLWDTFLYCYYASKMQQKSLALSSAFYNVPWYRMQPAIRRDLMFVSFKCQHMPQIKVAHYFYLNLKAFVNVLKITYDVTALLFRTVQE